MPTLRTKFNQISKNEKQDQQQPQEKQQKTTGDNTSQNSGKWSKLNEHFKQHIKHRSTITGNTVQVSLSEQQLNFKGLLSIH